VDGMADALRQDLESIRTLRVISRTSSVHYRGSSKALPEIARELKHRRHCGGLGIALLANNAACAAAFVEM